MVIYLFRNLAEDITFLLIVHKIITIEKRDLYMNFIEVILFNGGLLLVFLLISMISGSMLNFMSYIVFSLPLRIFSGGYRKKTSGSDFVIPTVMYVISVAVTEFLPLLYLDFYWRTAGIIAVIVIFVSEMYDDKKFNSIIICFLLLMDIVFFILSCIFDWKYATYELFFIVSDASLLSCSKIFKRKDDI